VPFHLAAKPLENREKTEKGILDVQDVRQVAVPPRELNKVQVQVQATTDHPEPVRENRVIETIEPAAETVVPLVAEMIVPGMIATIEVDRAEVVTSIQVMIDVTTDVQLALNLLSL
jgi:hypothetical protein